MELHLQDAMKFPLVGSLVLFSLYLAFKFLPKEVVNAILSGAPIARFPPRAAALQQQPPSFMPPAARLPLAVSRGCSVRPQPCVLAPPHTPSTHPAALSPRPTCP